MLAAHLDNFLFLIFFAVAILFQLLTSAAAKSRRRGGGDSDRKTTPPRTPRQPGETDEDRVRKFLEALGQPTTSKPPPPTAPRPVYRKPIVVEQTQRAPARPPLLSPLPPLTTQPPDWPRQIRLPGQIPPTREATPFRPTTPEPAFEVHRGTAPLESAAVIKTPAEAYAIATAPLPQATGSKSEAKVDLATLLKTTSALRDAIILREVFGPPRSLQPLDLVGNV